MLVGISSIYGENDADEERAKDGKVSSDVDWTWGKFWREEKMRRRKWKGTTNSRETRGAVKGEKKGKGWT